MSEQQAPAAFGRVDSDGTVYVRVGDTERSVGQIPDATSEEALAFYTRRYENLAAEVALLVSRVESQAMSPEEARKAIDSAKTNVAQANAVGDLAALTASLTALEELLPAQIEARKAARAEQQAATVAAKQAMVEEAETLAAGTDWRHGVDRFRELLEQWKQLPRIDRATDNELWHRFSSARTQYTRRRKAHFAELNARREEVKKAKLQIIEEAKQLATSTDWGPTAGAFRELMTRWKAAGSAKRADDDQLWAQFRSSQDEFFNARTAAQNAIDGEQAENLAAKVAMVEQAEQDLHAVTDVEAAKATLRSFLQRYSEVGHVPRNAMRDLDARVRTLTDRVAELEAERWRRTDPEARQRAEATVALFQAQVTKLTKELEEAQARGDSRRAKELSGSLQTYTAWLEQAEQTLQEFRSA